MYHSPNGNPLEFLKILDNFLLFITQWSNYDLIIGGDFNYNFDVTKDKRNVKKMLNLFKQYNFYHLNNKPTRGNNCLDNVYVREKSAKITFEQLLQFPYSDHEGVIINLRVCEKSLAGRDISASVLNEQTQFHLPRKHFKALSQNLASYDWSNMFPSHINGRAELMFKCIFDIIINNIEYLKVLNKPKGHNKPKCNKRWYNSELAKMKERLLFLNNQMKCTNNNNTIRCKYLELKSQYKKRIHEAKLFSNVNYIERSKNRCKAAWDVIKSNCEYKEPVISKIEPSLFNDYFVDSVNQIKQKTQGLVDTSCIDFLNTSNIRVNSSFHWSVVTTKDVMNAVKQMNSSGSIDVYHMSNNLLKAIIDSLAEPLAFCINNLLNEGVFPDKLKVSRVCPIYKKGPKDQPQSYRPISVIPVLGKLLEILVNNQIINYLENNNLLNNKQYGFRKGKSTINALDDLVRQVHLSFENKTCAQATFCDLSKAFDSVDSHKLLIKLNYYGFTGKSLKFFESYLQNRRQAVYIDGRWSNEVQMEWGVPQGSVLGPLLFLIYINDLPFAVNSNSILYADDSTFFITSKNYNELEKLANETLTNASDWFHSNGLLLNKEKTQNLIFTLNQNLVPSYYNEQNGFVSSAKFLGLYVDGQLTWNTHIDHLTTRLSRVIYLLSRLKNLVPLTYVKTAYYAYFQSIFRYGLILWGNCTRVNDILLLQKKAIRAITNQDPKEHCKPLFQELQIPTVINIYIFDITIYILDNPNLLKLKSSIHKHNTRGNRHALIEFHRLSKTLKSHIVIAIKIFNFLESIIKLYPLKEFKNKFYNWLTRNPFYSLDEFFKTKNIKL